jgi:hypothetical protein
MGHGRRLLATRQCTRDGRDMPPDRSDRHQALGPPPIVILPDTSPALTTCGGRRVSVPMARLKEIGHVSSAPKVCGRPHDILATY